MSNSCLLSLKVRFSESFMRHFYKKSEFRTISENLEPDPITGSKVGKEYLKGPDLGAGPSVKKEKRPRQSVPNSG